MHESEFSKTIPLDEFKKLSNPREKSGWIYQELVRESNLIEGINLDDKVFHNGDIEDYQAADHINAYEYVIQKHDKLLTGKEIREIHRILMHNIATKDMCKAGEYRKHAAYIRSSVRTPDTMSIINHYKGRVQYHYVPKAMQELELRVKNFPKDEIEKEELWNIHYDYEIIHPFSDGNGRSGRLLLNWLSLKYFQEFIVIPAKNKKAYYSNIVDREKIFKESNSHIKFYKDKTNQIIDPLYRIMF
jgi:Fic family protein